MAAASHSPLASVVESLTSEPEHGPALRARIVETLRGADCAELLRELRADPEYSFVVYEVPRDVCSKPREMLSWLLERLVVELVEERDDLAQRDRTGSDPK